MVVGVLTLELFFPDAASLKAKRSLTRPLLEEIRREWNASAAEVGDRRDAWQRATVAVASVNTETAGAHETLEAVARRAGEFPGVQLLDYSIEIL